MEIPRHVAIILDGNGRWARSRGMPRNYGHVRGAANVENICRAADELGIRYLTVYLFSTENWKRSQDEVKALMTLFHSYTRTAIRQARENNMRCRVLGDPSALDATLQKNLSELVESSKENTGLNFQLAINYGSRDEIVRAVRRLAEDYKGGSIGSSEEITEEKLASYLDTADIPDPESYHIETALVKSDDLLKSILRVTSDHGRDYGIRLEDESQKLENGSAFLLAPGKLLVLSVIPDEVIVISPKDIDEMGRTAHMLGNLHKPVQIGGGKITLLTDPVVLQTLDKINGTVDADEARLAAEAAAATKTAGKAE